MLIWGHMCCRAPRWRVPSQRLIWPPAGQWHTWRPRWPQRPLCPTTRSPSSSRCASVSSSCCMLWLASGSALKQAASVARAGLIEAAAHHCKAGQARTNSYACSLGSAASEMTARGLTEHRCKTWSSAPVACLHNAWYPCFGTLLPLAVAQTCMQGIGCLRMVLHAHVKVRHISQSGILGKIKPSRPMHALTHACLDMC